MTVGYCVRCKQKREMVNEQMVVMETGKAKGCKRMKGNCSVCNCKMSVMLGR